MSPIRMNPAHDCTSPAGQVPPAGQAVQKVRHFPAYKQGKTLAQEIDEYLRKEEQKVTEKVVDKK